MPPKSAAASSTDEIARARIVAGARAHFFALGFRGVTMDDLAKELGMSKKTLYAHYQSKLDLLQAVMLDKFAHVERDLEKVTTAPIADFMTVLHELLAILQRHTGEIQPIYVRDVQREAPKLFGMVVHHRQELIQRYFSKVLLVGIKAGMIRKDMPLELMIEILLGATEAVVNPTKITQLGLTPKEGLNAILTVFLEGVITREGKS